MDVTYLSSSSPVENLKTSGAASLPKDTSFVFATRLFEKTVDVASFLAKTFLKSAVGSSFFFGAFSGFSVVSGFSVLSGFSLVSGFSVVATGLSLDFLSDGTSSATASPLGPFLAKSIASLIFSASTSFFFNIMFGNEILSVCFALSWSRVFKSLNSFTRKKSTFSFHHFSRAISALLFASLSKSIAVGNIARILLSNALFKINRIHCTSIDNPVNDFPVSLLYNPNKSLSVVDSP
mmetsp:Transcript_28106/g.38650  ORF Transcript_28106/g.38650 Transcript_28106/m.38650 type:complete len:236 (+) Transcript_28106:152-859(+)